MNDLKLRVVQAAAAIGMIVVALMAVSERARTGDMAWSTPTAEAAP